MKIYILKELHYSIENNKTPSAICAVSVETEKNLSKLQDKMKSIANSWITRSSQVIEETPFMILINGTDHRGEKYYLDLTIESHKIEES